MINSTEQVILYEANIRQYTADGTFNEFAKHLPRLKNMGVNVIWLMPITPIAIAQRQGTLGSYYACSSYTKINPEFGTIDDFKQLVDAAHKLDIKVIIDWVANHTGYEHEWALQHPDWYIKDEQENFTERNGWKDVIDLDYSNAAMQDAMIDAMKFWMNTCNIDGFRCDMAHLVSLDFWVKAKQQCNAVKPAFWLAECDVLEYHKVFDVTYAWHWMHLTEKLMKGETNLQSVVDVLMEYDNYKNGEMKLLFTSNHDENSWNGTEYEKYGKLAKAFAVLSFTWKGVPLIYSGQELPNNKRLHFFDKDEIEWKDKNLLENFYQTVSSLHQCNAIAKGETILLSSQHHQILSYMRKYDEEIVLVILNLANIDRIKFTIDNNLLQGSFTNVFSNIKFNFTAHESFELMAGDFLVYKNFAA